MNNFVLNAILFGILYTDKGKQLANDAVNLIVGQVKSMLSTKETTEDG